MASWFSRLACAIPARLILNITMILGDLTLVVFVVFPGRGRVHWRAACSAAGCQGLN